MNGKEELLTSMENSFKSKVKLGDDNAFTIKGM